MTTSEIIEFKGRKFQRLGIMGFPQKGQWYLLGTLPIQATVNHDSLGGKAKREILRMLLPQAAPTKDEIIMELVTALKEFMKMWNSADATAHSERARRRRAAMWEKAEAAIDAAERGEK